MSQKLLGIDVARTTTTAEHELGMTVRDVRGKEGSSSMSFVDVVDGTTTTRYFFPDAEYMYIKAGSAISAGNACKISLTASNEPYTLIPTAAANDVVQAIAPVAIASASYGWVQVRGRVREAVNTGTLTAGDKLTASATAGALATVASGDSNVTSTKLNAAIAMAAGIGIQALDSNDSNAAVIEVMITH